MAVTVNTTIKDIELARNPLPIELETDNYITTDGVAQYGELNFTGLQNGSGETLIISWQYYSITFVTALGPDNSGLQIPRADEYANVNDWVADIAEYMNKNETLFASYEVWATNNIISLAAREKGTPYELWKNIGGTLTAVIVAGDTTNRTTGVDEVRREQFKLRLSVYVFKEEITTYAPYVYDEYEKAKTYDLEPLDDKTATFFINGALQPFFNNDILPDFNLLAITKNNNLLLKYYFRYSEYYGDPPNQQATYQSAVYYALNGGIKHKDYLDFDFYGNIINNGANSKFLSWFPGKKELTKQQHDYLYYIDTVGVLGFRLYVEAVLIDGTTETIFVMVSSNSSKDCYIIPVGYNYISSLGFTQEVVSYTVYLRQEENPRQYLTETKQYKIIPTPLRAKYFIFKNSLGVFESILFTGEKTIGALIDKQESEKIIGHDDLATTHQTITSSSNFTDTAVVQTGFKNQAELAYFIEFLKSKEVYEQTDTYYRPVSIDLKKVELYKLQEFVSSVKFNINYNTEQNYSDAGN